MTDREKVIRGLEIVWDAFNHMEHESYADYVFDALVMLKAQEPRVLTVDEISALDDGTVVWVDFTDGRLLPMIVEGGCLHRWKYLWRICESAFHDDYYMARAWTFHPTDEQREATPW